MDKKKHNSDKIEKPEQVIWDKEKLSKVLEEKPKKAKKEPEKKVEKKPEHYTLGMIGDHIQYNCKYCPFDTLLNEDAITEHVNASHIVGGKIRLRGVKYDSFGNEIK